jgi:cell division protein FtsB
LFFWVCLFVAAGCYAAVVLAPKLIVFEALEAEHAANQWRLVALEKRIDGLQKMIAAAQNDPAFVRELARSDFAIGHPDEQRIAVDAHLTLQIGGHRGEVSARRAKLPAYAPLLKWIALSRRTGDVLLVTAGGLIIGAFTLLPVRSSGGDE